VKILEHFLRGLHVDQVEPLRIFSFFGFFFGDYKRDALTVYFYRFRFFMQLRCAFEEQRGEIGLIFWNRERNIRGGGEDNIGHSAKNE
jgi:hypothetical protein